MKFRKYIYKLYLLLNNLSFFVFLPGIVTHEFGHIISCKLLSVNIKDYRFFVLPNSLFDDSSIAGGVDRESTSFKKRILIVFMPLVLNWSLVLSLLLFVDSTNILWMIFSFWIGFVFFSEGFPSTVDLKNINVEINNKKIDFVYNIFKGGLSFLLVISLI